MRIAIPSPRRRIIEPPETDRRVPWPVELTAAHRVEIDKIVAEHGHLAAAEAYDGLNEEFTDYVFVDTSELGLAWV